MTAAAKDRLKELLDKEGLAILQSPDRIKGWLAYSCPDSEQHDLLVAALEEGVPQALAQLQEADDLREGFAERRSLSEDQAVWAIDAWRDALQGKLADGSFDLFCREDDSLERYPDGSPRPKPPPLPLSPKPEVPWLERPETWVLLGAVVACIGLVLLLASSSTGKSVGLILLAIGACGLAAGWNEAETSQQTSVDATPWKAEWTPDEAERPTESMH